MLHLALLLSIFTAALSSCFSDVKLVLKKDALCVDYKVPPKSTCSLQSREFYPATLAFKTKSGESVTYSNARAVYGISTVCFNNTDSHFIFADGSLKLSFKDESVDVKDIEANELIYVRLSPGSGPAPVRGQTVMAHYTGMFLNGTVFDTSRGRQFPFMFHLGNNEVISGWDLTFAKMQAKEKGIIVVPYTHGYGEKGIPPTIPPKATLVFEVEMVQID